MYCSPRFGWYGVKPRTGPLNRLDELRRFGSGAGGRACMLAIEGGGNFFVGPAVGFATTLFWPFGAESSFFDTFFWLVLLADFTVFFDDGF
jgi:hypothetical protein